MQPESKASICSAQQRVTPLNASVRIVAIRHTQRSHGMPPDYRHGLVIDLSRMAVYGFSLSAAEEQWSEDTPAPNRQG